MEGLSEMNSRLVGQPSGFQWPKLIGHTLPLSDSGKLVRVSEATLSDDIVRGIRRMENLSSTYV